MAGYGEQPANKRWCRNDGTYSVRHRGVGWITLSLEFARGGNMDNQPAATDLGQRRVKKTGAGIAIGIALGAAIGTAMGNVGTGIAIGVALGVALGASISRKA